MKLILLGAPGAGKGTQAEMISEKLGVPIIGTGNIIRDHMKRATPEGKKARVFVDAGNLVPDELVIEMLKKRLEQSDCQNGYILDGFPRNVAQAQVLDGIGVVIDRVIDLEISDERIVERMAGRRVCGDCGSSYHMQYKPPKSEAKCDRCTGDLIIRDDDKPETVQNRLKVYHEQTEPLKDYYYAADKLYIVESQEEIEDTTRLTFAALEA